MCEQIVCAEKVSNVVALTGKMVRKRKEREGSNADQRRRMRARLEVHKKDNRQKVMVKVANRAARRTKMEAVKQILTFGGIESLKSGAGKVDVKIVAVKEQLKIYRDLYNFGFRQVVLSRHEEVTLPGGNVKKKQWTGEKLLSWLCAELKRFMQKIIDVSGLPLV